MAVNEETSGGAGASARQVRLEDLRDGLLVTGVIPQGPVTVVAVKRYGDDVLNLTYRTPSGQVAEQLLNRSNEPGLAVKQASASYDFGADGNLFKLAAEALRIRMAARFDPMMAVTTSDLEPLPHQIQAVYGELLERSPLRFVLADDPGAGKTIMAGLFIKELKLRGDLERCLIVAPGSLVEQWQEELREKFGLDFALLSPTLAAEHRSVGVVERYPQLIARMDQLARSPELREAIDGVDWDLAVVDEAHRMSARYSGEELKATRRYRLGQELGNRARHFLMMTATPHAGDEANFQAFMALADPDQFAGRYRRQFANHNAGNLMRRMVKEDLLNIDGRPLFPERQAHTVAYRLSKLERDLYDQVTDYVNHEMGRAESLQDNRTRTVGFALMILQRRLASSPEAILRSLKRRQRRLTQLRTEFVEADGVPLPAVSGLSGGDLPDSDELPDGEWKDLEDRLLDSATAARTLTELDAELRTLGDLVDLATRVRQSGADKKWQELNNLIQNNELIRDAQGLPRKLIVFTEHRDTIDYLRTRIGSVLGDDRAVVTIHGGLGHQERREIRDRFTQDKHCRILLATDAAGEGLNLQRAHLMVNYDLPWNPNRIEQRFGRIHRIGQTEVCHLWNLVAADTREGQVYQTLLTKAAEQRLAYGGKLFDVLGEAFINKPLHELLMEAIREGDDPAVRDRLNQVIDDTVREGAERLVKERSLAQERLDQADVAKWRLRMEEARARRLQPHFVKAFFFEAFKRLGGKIAKREPDRYEITHVPHELRNLRQPSHSIGSVLRGYERVTFERDRIQVPGRPRADLLAPGHPLLDAVVALIIDRHAALLRRGTVLVDRHDHSEDPRLMVAISQEVADGHDNVISKRFDFVELTEADARTAGPAPYLDYEPLGEGELEIVRPALTVPWLVSGIEEKAVAWAVLNGLASHLEELRERVTSLVERTRKAVNQRLNQQSNYWYAEYSKLRALEEEGKQVRMNPELAFVRSEEMDERLKKAMARLDADERLQMRPPRVDGAAMVIPQGLLDQLTGKRQGVAEDFMARITEVDRRAVAAVMEAERKLGRQPEEMVHNNPGFDIRSRTENDHWIFIEVKGRTSPAEEFVVSRTQVLTGKNSGERYRLALVSVHPDGPHLDELRYVVDPFKDFEFGRFQAVEFVGDWRKTWKQQGREPV